MSGLTERLRAADPTAAGQVFDAHATALFHCALGTTFDVDFASHVTTKMFVHLAALLGKDNRDIRKRLFRAMHAELARKKTRHAARELLMQALMPTLPQSHVERAEDMLRKLPEADREVLLLKTVGELSPQDIADITGLRYGDVAERARGTLRTREGEPEDVEIWLRRIKFRLGVAGLRQGAIEAAVAGAKEHRSQSRLWIVLLLLVLAALGVAYKIFGIEAIRRFFNL